MPCITVCLKVESVDDFNVCRLASAATAHGSTSVRSLSDGILRMALSLNCTAELLDDCRQFGRDVGLDGAGGYACQLWHLSRLTCNYRTKNSARGTVRFHTLKLVEIQAPCIERNNPRTPTHSGTMSGSFADLLGVARPAFPSWFPCVVVAVDVDVGLGSAQHGEARALRHQAIPSSILYLVPK